MQSLSNTLDKTSLGLNIAQNEFQSLRNSQFIESRVYEDDETLPEVDDQTKVRSVLQTIWSFIYLNFCRKKKKVT